MERITRREEGEASWNGKDYCEDAQDLCENYGFDCSTCPLGMVLERLCQYEDTGIEPEIISVLANRYIAEQGRKKRK